MPLHLGGTVQFWGGTVEKNFSGAKRRNCAPPILKSVWAPLYMQKLFTGTADK